MSEIHTSIEVEKCQGKSEFLYSPAFGAYLPGEELKSAKFPRKLHSDLKTTAAQLGLTIQEILADAYLMWKRSRVAAPVGDPNQPAEIPSPFAGLNDDQIWTVHNLIAILKEQPQGAIFRSLDLTLQLAINEYRKQNSAAPANQKTTGKSGHHPTRNTGT